LHRNRPPVVAVAGPRAFRAAGSTARRRRASCSLADLDVLEVAIRGYRSLRRMPASQGFAFKGLCARRINRYIGRLRSCRNDRVAV